MSDYSELKRLATAIESCTSILALEERAWMRRTTGEKVLLALEEIEELKAENEALRKDAERYRLIRTQGFRYVDTDYWSGELDDCDNFVDDPQWRAE